MKKYLILGLTLIVSCNAAILSSVAYNRSDALSSIELSGREFSDVNTMMRENSASFVRLDVRQPTNMNGTTFFTSHLSAEQLKQVGLSKQPVLNKHNKKSYGHRRFSKEVFLAIEYAGDDYKDAVTNAKSALLNYENAKQDTEVSVEDFSLRSLKDRVLFETEMASRLFYIDASLDKSWLNEKYSDNKNVFIMKGELTINYIEKKQAHKVSFARLYTPEIMLTRDLAQQVEQNNYIDDLDIPYYRNMNPKLALSLNIGKRLEPWISDVSIE